MAIKEDIKFTGEQTQKVEIVASPAETAYSPAPGKNTFEAVNPAEYRHSVKERPNVRRFLYEGKAMAEAVPRVLILQPGAIALSQLEKKLSQKAFHNFKEKSYPLVVQNQITVHPNLCFLVRTLKIQKIYMMAQKTFLSVCTQ